MPRGVPSPAVTHARNVPDEHLAATELMTVLAMRRRQGDPPTATVLDEVANAGVHARQCPPMASPGAKIRNLGITRRSRSLPMSDLSCSLNMR